MFVIGVTGGIGCGKSTFSQLLAEYGFPLIDADQISREATAAGGSAIEEIREAFGEEMIDETGGINRKKMADLVFRDKNKIDLLSSIVHESVIAEMLKRVAAEEKAGTKAVILDVPIPVKHGFLDTCDHIIVVWADEEIRIERLKERGMSADEAGRRMRVQMSQEEYERLGHQILYNNGNIEGLKKMAADFVKKELEPRGIIIL